MISIALANFVSRTVRRDPDLIQARTELRRRRAR